MTKCRRVELKFLDISLNGKCYVFFPFLLLNILDKQKYIYNVHVITQEKCLKRKHTCVFIL